MSGHAQLMSRNDNNDRTLQSLLRSNHSAGSEISKSSWSESTSLNQCTRLSEFSGEWRMFTGWSPFRLMCYDMSESKCFSGFILCIIAVNTATIAVQTDFRIDADGGFYLSLCDSIFLGVYLFEMLIKLFVWRWGFFSSGWNKFDVAIVTTSCLDVLWTIIVGSFAGFDPKIFRLLRVFRTVRALRALRVLRTIKFFQSLQIIVSTFLKSMPAWGSISLLLLLILYIYAIIGVTVYGTVAPTKWGNLWKASFTLFTLFTMDNWSLLYEAAMGKAPTIPFFLSSFIVLETFILLQLFVAVIVNNLQELQRGNKEKLQHHLRQSRRKNHHSGTAALDDTASDQCLNPWNTSMLEVVHETGPEGRPVEHYYDSSVNTSRNRQLLGYTLMLMAAVENQLEAYEKQQRTLDDLVDIAHMKNEK